MKRKQDIAGNDEFARLRERAVQRLHRVSDSDPGQNGKDVNLVFQELQVHQVELEMQNDELRIANEELEIQRMKLAGIYDLAPVGYFILDGAGTIEEVNNAAVKLFEVPKTSLYRKKLQNFLSEDHLDAFNRFYHLLRQSSEKQSCQLRFISQHERAFYAQVEGIEIKNTGQCYLAIVDITEVIAARKDLAETKDRLELALQASSAGTWEMQVPSMAFYLDEINHRITHAKEWGFKGTYPSFLDLVHPEDRFAVDQHFRTAINAEHEIDQVCRFMSPKGKITFATFRGHVILRQNDAAPHRFVGIMCDITEAKNAEKQAEALKRTQEKETTAAILYAGENERKRISEALHDSVSQLLYGVKIQLSQLSKENTVSATARLQLLLDVAIQETRNISFELAPAILTDFGLAATIHELCERLSSSSVRIKSKVLGFSARSNLLLETTVYRITQELINNCMKHAQASQIQVLLEKTSHIEIRVDDNGRGFEPASGHHRPTGAGLSSIKNRLSLYNGTLQIDSKKGKGTKVKISIYEI